MRLRGAEKVREWKKNKHVLVSLFLFLASSRSLFPIQRLLTNVLPSHRDTQTYCCQSDKCRTNLRQGRRRCAQSWSPGEAETPCSSRLHPATRPAHTRARHSADCCLHSRRDHTGRVWRGTKQRQIQSASRGSLRKLTNVSSYHFNCFHWASFSLILFSIDIAVQIYTVQHDAHAHI